MDKKNVLKPAIINLTAEIEGLTTTSVRRVLRDTQNNEQVFETYLLLEDEMEKAVNNVKLVRAVEKKFPFGNNPSIKEKDLNCFPDLHQVELSIKAKATNKKSD